MADSVDTMVLQSGGRYHATRLTNVSDGTGESAVAKVTLSGLLTSNKTVPTKTRVREIFWNIQGFTSVRLFWDHTTPDEIAMLSGSGYLDLTSMNGLLDPGTAGGTGNITLTTAGNVSGATYTIVLIVELI